jgi:TfoX/Sxy family transcriptional regulator of competence genes
MASKKDTLDFVLGELSNVEDVSSRKMMGEYLIYVNKKVVGGIYDDRFMLKNTPSVQTLLKDCPKQSPYDGAKPMINASDIIFDAKPENKNFFKQVLSLIYDDLK